jgi:hypothetical protein
MITANAKAIAIATCDEYRQFMIYQFGASGNRQGPPMQSMHAIRIEKSGKVR